jgi:hypothetical protein
VEAYPGLDLSKEYSFSKLSVVHVNLSYFIACMKMGGEEEEEE